MKCLLKIFIVLICLFTFRPNTYAQYLGGNGHGNNVEATCSTDLDGASTVLTIGSISGSLVFCNNASETYEINITAGSADSYLWTGPTGTTVLSQQIDGYASLLFGTTSGNVSVEVSNACATVSTSLAVTNSACDYYKGGNNDGNDNDASCSTTLDGVGTGLTIGALGGPAVFCDNGSETFSINVTAGTADNFLWTGPTGTTVLSQQIDGYASLLFGTTSGNVSVEVSNACATVSTSLAVTNSACNYYEGGNNDGNDNDASCSTTLDGVGTGLTIGALGGSAVFCDNSSETFSIDVTAGTADNFLWTGPTGTTVLSQQIDGYASLLFGTTSGNVSVEVSNACATVSTSLAVTNSACDYYEGGNNDGNDNDASCSTTLDGVGTGLTIGALGGSAVFCDNSSETFSVNVTAGTADNFLWTGPTGTTVLSQQIDGYASLLFGTTSGNVSVEASNACATVSTSLAVTNSACDYYEGGNNDGNDNDASCSTTLDGVGTGLTIGALGGSAVFCDNSSETFSINVTAGTADNFLWTGPTGTTILSQQIDGYASLLFGTTSGNVNVEVSNACATVSTSLAVTNSACDYYEGGSNDGNDDEASCNTDLNGTGAGLTIGSVSGPSAFCNDQMGTYTVTVTAGVADNFLWTGPTGTSVISQQIEGFASLLFGSTSGNVSVAVSNSCATTSAMLPVSNVDCNMFIGGSAAGATFASSASSIGLPVTLLEFTISLEGNIVKLNWITSSEINNDHFTLERSRDKIDWEQIEEIRGAGNSNVILTYETHDLSPYMGLSYYRLKQTDYDGTTSYSNVKSIEIVEGIAIYPNPASDHVIVQGKEVENRLIELYNGLGSRIHLPNHRALDRVTLDVSQLRSGIYFLKINEGMENGTRKILVQH